VTERTALLDELAATWRRDIPLTAAMGIAVESYDGLTLAVRAPLEANRNLHGTVFAGSLFSACALTGWGAIWLALRERGLDGVIFAADSRIQFRKGVAGDHVCRCTPDAEALKAGIDKLEATGRASFDVVCTIDQGEKRAVTFTGRYVVHAKHA
jgi:thioesterase domain-containing protein